MKYAWCVLCILISLSFLKARNDFPIVLIHGFMGWGPDEMGSYNYWGGKNDFVKDLEKQGHVVFELSVGPVSSNWERAIEAYYQLKGGQVDYGKKHADRYGIIQKPEGKVFEAVYPEVPPWPVKETFEPIFTIDPLFFVSISKQRCVMVK